MKFLVPRPCTNDDEIVRFEELIFGQLLAKCHHCTQITCNTKK